MIRAAILLACVPMLAAAEDFDGIYKQVANADCTKIGEDGGALRIDGGIFYGVEVQCLMTRPVDVREMDAMLFTMQCSGEGEVWTERAMLMNAAEGDGIIMVWNGYAFAYDRCDPVE